MKALLRRYGGYVIAGVVGSALTAGGPALAATIADYAKNADKVDGKHAVASSATVTQRANKLVATNSAGLLPNNIIAKAPDANKLDNLDSTAFLRTTGKVGLGNLAPNSVNADKIVNGSITKDELADGAVTTDKLLVNFAKGDDTGGPVAPLGLPFVEVPADNTKIVTTDTTNHNIMVSGQTQLTCGACAAATDNVVVRYQLVRTDDTSPTPTTTVIGPIYEGTLNAPTTVSLSLLDTNVPADTYVYKIRLARSGGTAGVTFTATKTVLNVVDQGRFQTPAP